MKSNRREKLLSRYLDGDISRAGARKVETWMEEDDSLRKTREEYEALGDLLRQGGAVDECPSAERMWQDVRRSIRNLEPDAGPAQPAVFGSRVRWATAMVMVLFAALGAWVVLRAPEPGSGMDRVEAAEVEWVETDLPGASTMVYRDADTEMTVIWLLDANDAESTHVGS